MDEYASDDSGSSNLMSAFSAHMSTMIRSGVSRSTSSSVQQQIHSRIPWTGLIKFLLGLKKRVKNFN